MSDVKDKKISVYYIETSRTKNGQEIKTKHYVHNRFKLWAFIRNLNDRERFAANAAGARRNIIFKVNYNAKLSAEMYIEFNDKTYKIESIDNLDFYKREMIINGFEVVAEVTDNEIYDQ